MYINAMHPSSKIFTIFAERKQRKHSK